MNPPIFNSGLLKATTREAAPSVAPGGKSRLLRPCKPVQGLPIGSLDPMFQAGCFSALANEAAPDRFALIGLGNEMALSRDGWALIPYGDHPNERGLQPFHRAEAERMVGYFKNTWNTVKRAFVGMPVLRGHPDMAKTVKAELAREKDPAKRAGLQSLINTIERRYPDKTVYGTISDLEARDDGLAIKTVLTEEGAALVNEGGLTHFSPHWLCIDGEPVGGKPTKVPVFLVSIGLTDRPNIAGTSLINERSAASLPLTTMNKQHLLALLAALGRPLANEATEEQINAALAEATPLATALAARPETTALANEQSRVTELTGQLTAAQKLAQDNATALANERTALAAAITARNEAVVNAAVAAGKITEAAKPVWLGRLARDFAVESVALANEAPALKTNGKTGNLGDRKIANTARDQFTALVNERVVKGEIWEAAWHAVKATTSGKALYEQMNAGS
jgi:hypothetical protein